MPNTKNNRRIDTNNKKATYKISALTWNVANTSSSTDSVKLLAKNLKKANPDVILVSLQEAKRFKNMSIGQRIFNLLKFKLLYSNYFNVITKPKRLKNWLNIAETNLVIGVKPELINRGIFIENSHSGIECPNRMNKGGLYTSLRIGHSRIGIISVHLESYKELNREKEVDALMRHFPNSKFDQVIFMGDLNERLNSNIISDNIGGDDEGGIDAEVANNEGVSKVLMETYDPVQRGETYITTKHGIKFQPLQEPTYQEIDKKGLIKNKKGRNNRIDYGGLDNIGYKNNNDKSRLIIKKIDNKSNIVVNPRDTKTNKNISDHKAVIVHFELADKNTNSRKNFDINESKAILALLEGSTSKNNLATDQNLILIRTNPELKMALIAAHDYLNSGRFGWNRRHGNHGKKQTYMFIQKLMERTDKSPDGIRSEMKNWVKGYGFFSRASNSHKSSRVSYASQSGLFGNTPFLFSDFERKSDRKAIKHHIINGY